MIVTGRIGTETGKRWRIGRSSNKMTVREVDQKKGATMMENADENSGGGVDLPDLEDFAESPEQSDLVADVGKRAIKIAVLGSGQAGGKLADTFWGLGYRSVLAVNTSEQDLNTLVVPTKNKYAIPGYSGSGKSPELGRKAALEYREEIIQKMNACFGRGVDWVLICVGGGGGSGSGSVEALVGAAKEYLTGIGKEDGGVGVMMALPKRSEKGVAQKNALELLGRCLESVKGGFISPLVIVDNGQIDKLMPNMSVTEFWSRANKAICGLFDVFNLLAARNDGDPTFDVKEYKQLLSGGIMTFGQTKVKDWKGATDIADAVRLNIRKGLLAEGFDLKDAKQAVGILTAPQETLGQLLEKQVDLAFDSLGRLCDEKNVAVHRGVYPDKRDGVYFYTAVSGLRAPEERVKEISRLAGVKSDPVMG